MTGNRAFKGTNFWYGCGATFSFRL